ncbi:hypothetical protein G3578_01295 [Brevibacillus sp. SYP-B805]|uniref:hypothetical protein n=1 Tax=Brevibacillus sp. SYP-B805 TaxID=1578199 RepID=UPI0013EC6894|nr:hypothetical protein [Brevibacillus sp. SYP-B805]NGQ93804.1 hypothetical protein [Brevibacillus sp. SYP-B805]
MNVIGIVQTDLNEFNILFDQGQNHQSQQGSGQNQHQQNGGSGQQNSSDDNSGIFNLLNDDDSQNQALTQQNQGPQEMTVRIKGIPEGEKATFLQMYQIIQDAKATQDIEQKCTVISRGDEQGQTQQQGQDLSIPGMQ